MIQTLIDQIHSLPNELIVALLAAMPIVELRAAIPVALLVFHLPAMSAYFFSVFGNLLPMIVLYAFLPRVIASLSTYSPKLHKIFERYFFRLSEKHGKALDRFGSLFLFVFVSIPHPGGGVWSACALAILFRLHPRFAVPAIIGGVLVAGMIVLYLTETSVKLF